MPDCTFCRDTGKIAHPAWLAWDLVETTEPREGHGLHANPKTLPCPACMAGPAEVSGLGRQILARGKRFMTRFFEDWFKAPPGAKPTLGGA